VAALFGAGFLVFCDIDSLLGPRISGTLPSRKKPSFSSSSSGLNLRPERVSESLSSFLSSFAVGLASSTCGLCPLGGCPRAQRDDSSIPPQRLVLRSPNRTRSTNRGPRPAEIYFRIERCYSPPFNMKHKYRHPALCGFFRGFADIALLCTISSSSPFSHYPFSH